jgi:glycosyltransferase involved in cell wall biosynthesis
MRVDQFVTGFAPHDAIGNHTLQVRRALRAAGYESQIWAEAIHPPLDKEARPFGEDKPGGDGRALLYQCSTNSALAPWLADRADRGERLLSQYHNVTPARYFERWHRETARAMEQARQEMAMLAPKVGLALPVSAFNEQELLATGYQRTAVCPLLVDLDDYHKAPAPKTLDRLRRRRHRSGAQWLFVGRFAPNKCQHDVIGAFAAFRRLVDPGARLTLVGGASHPRYKWAVERLAHQLQLGDSVEMLEGLPEDQLLAHWAVADVFVCLSEHEGFCVPLVEAMELSVPVVAYRATAVPETLGEAGILVDDKGPVSVARAVEEACRPGRRQDLVRAGRERAAEFSLKLTSARLVETIGTWLQAS